MVRGFGNSLLGIFRTMRQTNVSAGTLRSGIGRQVTGTTIRNPAYSTLSRRLQWTSGKPWQSTRRHAQPASWVNKSRRTGSTVNFSRRNFHSSKTRRTENASNQTNQQPEPLSFSQRMKKLSREYGWSAVGVYLGLTVLDLPFCFLLVRAVGTDRIAEAEHVVVTNIAKVIPESVKEFWRQYRAALKDAEKNELGNNDVSNEIEMAGWGVKEAEEKNKSSEASLGTQLALAYAIHKSFIFIRVPLTAAITPKVVKTLRSWGWQIGKRRSKR